jgi:hypothetical protein
VWTDDSDNESGFKVERSADGGSSWTQIWTTAPNVEAFAAVGLSGLTEYQFRVRAFNLAGDSAYSNTVSVRIPLGIAGGWELTAPSAPAGPGRTGPSDSSALVGLRTTKGVWNIDAPGVYGNVDHDGEINVNADGVVLENFIKRGPSDINLVGRRDVTIRNFITYDQKSFNSPKSTNFLVERGAMYRPMDSCMWGVYTARWLYIEEVAGDCFKPHGPSTIEYCYVNKVGWPENPEAHADGLQTFGITGVTFRYNRIDSGEHAGVNSAVNFSISNSRHLIEYNYFSGGAYQVYLIPDAGDNGVVVRHNRWGRTGSPVYSIGGDYSRVVWEDNAYLDNGTPIPKPE